MITVNEVSLQTAALAAVLEPLAGKATTRRTEEPEPDRVVDRRLLVCCPLLFVAVVSSGAARRARIRGRGAVRSEVKSDESVRPPLA